MIKIVRGDLLKAPENFICHQVNCVGKMGSGVALQVKKKHELVYENYLNLVGDYNITEDLRHTLLGQVQAVAIDRQKWIVNMFGQNTYGYDGKQYTDTDALFSCFKLIRAQAERMNLSVAMPYLVGCYRGGADWKIVEDHLLTAFDGYEVTLYKLHRG